MANNSNTKVLNVPALRFKEFEGEWENHLLSEYLEFKNGLNPDANRFGKGLKFISVMDILNNQYITYDCIKAEVEPREGDTENFGVKYGDILFQRSSETLEDVGQANVYMDDKVALFGGFVIRGRKIGNYNPLFFRHLLSNPIARKKIIVKGAGAQHFNIGQDSLSKVSLHFPTIVEQNKIASLLSLIDERISTQNKIIEDLKKLKSAIGKKLLFNPTWKKCLIKDIAEIKGGGTPSSSNPSYWFGDIPWVSSSDINEDNINDISITRYISKEAVDNSATKICSSPFILIVSRVGVGKVAISNSLLCTSQDFCNLIEVKCNITFLAYELSYIMKRKAKEVQGTSIKGITIEEIQKILIYIPNIDVQCKIATYLSKIDALLSTESKLLLNFRLQKAYLLQQMFI